MPKDFGFRKRLDAKFYHTPSGAEPVREWIRALDSESRKVVGSDIREVEYGWPVGLPVCRPLGNRLWEVRSNLPNGTIARVIFTVIGDQMVLLHAFIKKTQQTPAHEVQLALRRLKSIG